MHNSQFKIHKRVSESSLAVAVVTALIAVSALARPAARVLTAQSAVSAQPGPRTFEVASVKPGLSPAESGRLRAAGRGSAAPNIFGIRTFPGGRLTANATLKALIGRAYGVKDYQIEGGPAWLSQDYFTIEARAGGDATADEFNAMLRALLEARFSLRARAATRPGRVYSLVLARTDGRFGPGLKRTSPECTATIEERKRLTAAGTPPPPRLPAVQAGPVILPDLTVQCGISTWRGRDSSAAIAAGGQPLSLLVDELSRDVGGTVADRTGLDGLFDFLVEFEPPASSTSGIVRGLDANATDSPQPPLRIAIERQLGLKLESVEGQVPLLVIDAVDQPTPD